MLGVMDEEKAVKTIANKIAEAEELISECEDLADKYNLSFSWDLSYGMGGTYYGCDDVLRDEDAEDEEYGWHPSSQSC